MQRFLLPPSRRTQARGNRDKIVLASKVMGGSKVRAPACLLLLLLLLLPAMRHRQCSGLRKFAL